jgi:hypothetical protein
MMGVKDDHQKCEGTVTTSIESVKAKSGNTANVASPGVSPWMRILRPKSEDKNMRYTSNFLRGLFIVSLAGLPIAAHALDSGQYSGVPDNVRSWFKSVRSPHGVPCCDVSDGHRTSYDMRADNHYWVPIEGEWHQVPQEAIVYNAGNPVGEAVVWYVRQGPDSIYIRCFVPGGGV